MLRSFRSIPICAVALILSFLLPSVAQTNLRARDLGVPFDGAPGPNNAITDIKGIEVGQTTLISGEGKLIIGKGPVRTGVTAILPRGKTNNDAVFAGWFTLNGNGEMTGTTWVEDSGFLNGPVMITNTHSVGVVRDAVIAWKVKHGSPDMEGYWWSLPVVAETWDGWLNDINGFHVHPEDAWHALDTARSGAVEEGNVGGGTGMICNEFKGGIGTSSRVLPAKAGGYTVGVLVQCNYGRRDQLRIAGVPVGKEIPEKPAYGEVETASNATKTVPAEANLIAQKTLAAKDVGSIIVVVATDAPLIPTQLKRVARKVSLGLGRDGSYSGDGSGDIFLAFSTANPGADGSKGVHQLSMLPNDALDPIFLATVQATEEAIVNAMVAAKTMKGIDDHEVIALPHDRLREVLKKYNRLVN
ncbi:MAG TPA: P1 family peptidase [Candidatus Sulfotelmatobacter sp.]|jgi:L-aminopeptidase/D-esterase-like protein